MSFDGNRTRYGYFELCKDIQLILIDVDLVGKHVDELKEDVVYLAANVANFGDLVQIV